MDLWEKKSFSNKENAIQHTKENVNLVQEIHSNTPLVDPTARVAPSDIKSTEVKGASAVITFTDLRTQRFKY